MLVHTEDAFSELDQAIQFTGLGDTSEHVAEGNDNDNDVDSAEPDPEPGHADLNDTFHTTPGM